MSVTHISVMVSAEMIFMRVASENMLKKSASPESTSFFGIYLRTF